MASKIIISDTSCLIALSRINKLEILQKLFTTIITTPEVKAEFGAPLPAWVTISEVKDLDRKLELETLLDKGEASSIALALEVPQSILIIDEKKGRKIARSLNIQIIGTLKILMLARQKGEIDDLSSVIKELEQKNFRFSRNIIARMLNDPKNLT